MNERDAEQGSPIAGGSPAIGCRRFVKRVLGGEGDHGVQSRVQPLDPAEEMPRELDTRNFAGSQAAA
jgi:hypothetical protein